MPKKVDLIVNNGLTVAEINWNFGGGGGKGRAEQRFSREGTVQIPDFETFNIFGVPLGIKIAPSLELSSGLGALR